MCTPRVASLLSFGYYMDPYNNFQDFIALTTGTTVKMCGYKDNCLAPCDKPQCTEVPKKKGFFVKKQEEENLMNYASASISAPATETQDQRKYLSKRLDEVYRTKRDPLEGIFGLTDDATPQGPKEVSERIAAGKFVIRGLEGEAGRDYSYWAGGDLIQWRDPAKKADQDGFTAAKKDLKAKYQTTLDTIKIDEPKAGLDAIKALEAWEPTGKSS